VSDGFSFGRHINFPFLPYLVKSGFGNTQVFLSLLVDLGRFL
jgi:hypothetical protein